MQTTKFLNVNCVTLKNESVSLLVAQSAGPRILSLQLKGGQNLFAELPNLTADHPGGKKAYRFLGGHRLWHAPENMPRTYMPDDQPVEIIGTGNSLTVIQQVEAETGIEKSIRVSLVEDKPQIIIQHTLTNRSHWNIECAPWAITQLKPGGVAILPQSQEQTGLLANRSLAIWPYTNVASPNLTWGNKYILLRAEMKKDETFKIGFPNPRGWIAYWQSGTLFVKRAAHNPQSAYYDFNSSSECYCNDQFLELETLAPISTLQPEGSVAHTETWELYDGVESPTDEKSVDAIVAKLGLE